MKHNAGVLFAPDSLPSWVGAKGICPVCGLHVELEASDRVQKMRFYGWIVKCVRCKNLVYCFKDD